MVCFGIDFGGSGIKGSPVNVQTGDLVEPRKREQTPTLARPGETAEVISQILNHFEWKGPVGVGFPAEVHDGIIYSAANIHESWIGVDAAALFKNRSGNLFYIINDADAAGIAEMSFGAGKCWQKGVVLILTIGTGIGSAIFVDGHLFPNTELGHLQVRGKDAEKRASDAIRQKKEFSWKQWAERFQEVISTYEHLFSPDMIILGGGASKNWLKFSMYLKTRAQIQPAQLLNQAGIIGAAVYASWQE
jgi:polyphosphate glucokinase